MARGAKPKVTHKINVQIDEDFSGDMAPALFRAAARTTLAHQQAPPGELSIVVSGDETLQQLNAQFLHHNYPTDVLSFPAEEDVPDSAGKYFGDIAISFPRALAQATAGGHPVQAELQLLTVHGVLHLLGYDHATADDKRAMWQAQREILVALNCEITEPKL